MSTLRKYVRDNVFGRCGQAVSRLVASELIPRPEMATSESEVHEWWLVSPDLAAKLRAARSPVLQFCELHMWGREASGTALEDDEELMAAIGKLPARPAPAARRGRPRTPHRRR